MHSAPNSHGLTEEEGPPAYGLSQGEASNTTQATHPAHRTTALAGSNFSECETSPLKLSRGVWRACGIYSGRTLNASILSISAPVRCRNVQESLFTDCPRKRLDEPWIPAAHTGTGGGLHQENAWPARLRTDCKDRIGLVRGRSGRLWSRRKIAAQGPVRTR